MTSAAHFPPKHSENFVQPKEKTAVELVGASWLSGCFSFGVSITKAFREVLPWGIWWLSPVTPKLPQQVAVLLLHVYHLRSSALPISFYENQSQYKYSTVQIFYKFLQMNPCLAIIYC